MHPKIRAIAERFALELLNAVREMSLDEILDHAPAKPNGAPRAKSKAVATTRAGAPKLSVDAIVATLRQHKNGMRSQDLRAAVARNLSKKAWSGAIKRAIAAKKVRMTGTKSWAMYFAT